MGADLTEGFQRITRATHVEALDVLVAKSGPVSLDVVVRFENGTSALPQQVFSEGYKDLIAMLFFLSVTKKASEFGQARVLVLDDALQSVDSTIRVGLIDYVLERFKDWQLIIAGHDRAWLSQLRGLFAKHGRVFAERTIQRWSFDQGPVVAGAAQNRADSLTAALAASDVRQTAAGIGLLLEEICQELSWRVQASVTRREGDRYTLGDLWPGVVRAFRATSLKALLSEIDMRLHIRNLLGAHFNDWADGIAWSDVEKLAQDVLSLYAAVYCEQCGNWVAKHDKVQVCRCGKRTLAPTNPD